MSARAAPVEVLIEKSRFEPEVAFGIAEAIDMAIDNAQPVTVPILDARFATAEAKIDARFATAEAKIDARFTAAEAKTEGRFTALEASVNAKLAEVKAELVRWVFLVMLGNVALTAGITAILNAMQRGG